MADGKRAGKSSVEKVGDGLNTARRKAAPIVGIVFLVLAGILAIGALLIALDANRDNAAVEFMLNTAANLDLGVFDRQDGIFTFDGKNAEPKSALVNWGLAAILYLIVGRVLKGIVEP